MCLEGITTLQKSLLSHTFLCGLSFFTSKRMRKIHAKKKKLFFYFIIDVISLSNADSFHRYYPFPFGIMKRITAFSCFELCFET